MVSSRAALLACLCLFISQVWSGYAERLVVQVYDQSFRPVEGAKVYVNYQKNAIDGYVYSKPKYTGENGTADIVFVNYEQINSSTLWDYRLYVEYGKDNKSKTLTATNNYAGRVPRILSEFVESSIVYFNVHDQKGAPLQADVTVDGKTKRADAFGRAAFQLPPGAYAARTEIAGTSLVTDVNALKDANVDVEIGLYDAEVHVKNDAGEPYAARVEAGGRAANTDSQGVAVFYNLSKRHVEMTAFRNQTAKKVNADLGSGSRVDIVFDLTKPLVTELRSTVNADGSGSVMLAVDDRGKHASGIDSVRVFYEINGVVSQAKAYTAGYNAYGANIPSQPPGTAVRYSVKVTDRDGNVGLGEGVYSVPIPKSPEDAGQDRPRPKPAEQMLGMGAETVAIYLTVFAVAAFGVFYFFKGKKRPSPPNVPPSPPPAMPQ